MVHAPFFFLHFTSFFFSTWVGAGGTLRAFLPFSPLISCFLLLLLLVASFLPLILCRKELFAPWLFAKFTQYLSIFQLSNCPIWLLKRSCAFFTYQWLSISQKSLVTPPFWAGYRHLCQWESPDLECEHSRKKVFLSVLPDGVQVCSSSSLHQIGLSILSFSSHLIFPFSFTPRHPQAIALLIHE